MGSGFKTFTAGSVLTASDVQNYLQDQAVMVFAGTAARSSAIGTANFEEGMLTYLTDVDKLQVYTGATFADVYPPAASNQGLTLLNTTSFSAVASQSINDVFSATYRYYRVVFDLTASSASANIALRLRVSGSDASGGNYSYGGHENFVNSATYYSYQGSNATTLNLGTSNTHFGTSIDVRRPFLTEPTQFAISTIRSDGTINSFTGNGVHTLGTSYTGFTIYPASGTISGSVSTFGYSV